MKKICSFIFFAMLALCVQAGVTTYTFTSASWASKVGATTCDGTTDGWTSDKDGAGYDTGYTDAQGLPYSKGVKITSADAYSGAGATSVISFTGVRKITFNFCQNSSKGRGIIYAQVGSTLDSIVVTKPATSGSGVYLRDSSIVLSTATTGQVKFWVKCTENSLYINSISVRAEEGGSSIFTMATYQLVTDVAQLEDSDQIIIGVPAAGKIMGYFDEGVSQNNIHAITGKFADGGTTVGARDEAIYTLHKTTLNGATAYYIQDEIRYEEAYLVASGGRTKNRLALWDHLYDEGTYGNYGYWDIQVAADGDATIMNLGNSLGKYLQYNASNNPTLFGCYPTQGSQTAVKIYRRVEALGDVAAIVAPLVNFGNIIMEGTEADATAKITVNANRLSTDIQASIDNSAFALSSSTLDRDGDELTISLHATAAGHYSANLTLQADTVTTVVSVLATVVAPMKVREAVHQPDYAILYLQPVEVTKKFDKYIFVRDSTGAMLIYDQGDGTGKRYGADLKSGDILSGVVGRMQNYFGVPELTPTAAFSSRSTQAAEAETVTGKIDSADVCRFVRLEAVRIVAGGEGQHISWQSESLPVIDAFEVGVTTNTTEDITAIVMISWDEVQLWLVSETPLESAIEAIEGCDNATIRKAIINGQLRIITADGIYDAQGRQMK